MNEIDKLHDEAEEIRAENRGRFARTGRARPRSRSSKRQLEEANSKALYAAAEMQNVRRRLEAEKTAGGGLCGERVRARHAGDQGPSRPRARSSVGRASRRPDGDQFPCRDRGHRARARRGVRAQRHHPDRGQGPAARPAQAPGDDGNPDSATPSQERSSRKCSRATCSRTGCCGRRWSEWRRSRIRRGSMHFALLRLAFGGEAEAGLGRGCAEQPAGGVAPDFGPVLEAVARPAAEQQHVLQAAGGNRSGSRRSSCSHTGRRAPR